MNENNLLIHPNDFSSGRHGSRRLFVEHSKVDQHLIVRADLREVVDHVRQFCVFDFNIEP